MTITVDHFPTPDLALRSAASASIEAVRGFAHHQAEAATAAHARLAAHWPGHDPQHRVDLLRQIHDELVQWRADLAARASGRLGVGIPLDASRFRTSIRDGGVNHDRIGTIGRLRDGATFNPATGTYEGGQDTPAWRIMRHYGQAALDRFTSEEEELPNPDVLLNVVPLPGGSGRMIAGNRLVRGDAARAIGERLVARVAARGHDTSRMDIGGQEALYVVGAAPDDADTMFAIALWLLADTAELDGHERLRAWQRARYLLFQSPRTKKGSDAVTRVILVAVGALIFGRAPVMQQDADLRCMVFDPHDALDMPADEHLLEAHR